VRNTSIVREYGPQVEAARPLPAKVSWIALLAIFVAIGGMAVDHLLGTEREEGEGGLADPATFAISVLLCLVAAWLCFGWLVPRARRDGTGRAASVALALSLLSVVPGIALLWLGFPLVTAGAGAQLGLESRSGPRRRVALVAVAVGVALIAFGTVAYTYAVVDGISEL
jgi:hypothetical protein